MSTLMPVQMEPPRPLLPLVPQPALPEEILGALRRWQNIRKNGWLLVDAVISRADLFHAGELALASGRDSLSRALGGLAQYLGFLVDSEVVALSPPQLQGLAKLESCVLGLLRAERAERQLAAPPDNRKVVLLLAPELPLWQCIVDRLNLGSYRIERFAQAEPMVRRLNAPGAAAVLIDEDFLLDLGSVADRLEGIHEAGSLGTTVLFFNRNRDPQVRNLALRGGADTSLEGSDIDHLVARVKELIDVRERQENLRVLVVEDDRSQALYCELILRKQGIDVKIAHESLHAMAAIREFLPDLVLMDLHMPDVDGMQLTELIRDQPDLAMLPIIFLTGEQDEASRFNALRAGGDDYLVKPVRPRHLITAVVTRARRARKLRQQFAARVPDLRKPRLLHAGEFIAMLRMLGSDQPCHKALLMCAPDQAGPPTSKTHVAIELESQFKIARQTELELADDERIAPWPGGAYLLLLDRPSDHELFARARIIRQQVSDSMRSTGAGDASMAVVSLPTMALPSAESLVDLAERTIDVARHAGGKRVKGALTESHTDLPADVSLGLEKALAMAPSPETLNVLFQPIVSLHGAPRPQYHLHLGVRIGPLGERKITRLQWRPMARQIGCSSTLDRYAVEQALDCLKANRKSMPGLRVFVAVDASSIAEPAFLEALLVGLAMRGLQDPGLVLCIDHSEAMFTQNRMLDARRQLESARVLLCFGRVGVDAKGSDVIESLRPEILAVDAAALRASALTPAILGFAHQRGAELVAHFIPDANTLARLFALGVDYGMGNFVGAPRAQLDYDFGDGPG